MKYYVVYEKKAYLSKKVLSEIFEVPVPTLIVWLSNSELPNFRIDREVLYQTGEVFKYLNDKTGKNLKFNP